MIVVLVETDAKGVVGVSQEVLTFARELSTRSADAVQAVVIGEVDRRRCAAQLGEQGVAVVHHPDDERLHDYAAAAWAAAVVDVVESAAAGVLMAAGTPRGMEVLAHAATRLDVAMAANVVQVDTPGPVRGDPPGRRRRRAGGDGAWPTGWRSSPWPGTPATRSRPRPRPRPRSSRSRRRSPTATSSPGCVRVEATESDDTGALTSARVVVGAGRGAGGAEGFTDLLELTELLGGALGVSRVVTSLGWRPHSEQVGQTGSRIAPEVYIPCGISGAIQHWAGCQSAKTIIAINTDPEAPMVTKAHYAVIGDLHEIVPAINAELRARRRA